MIEIIEKLILRRIGYSLINRYYNDENNVNVILFKEKLYVRYNLISEIAIVFGLSESNSFILIKYVLKKHFNVDVYEFSDSEFMNTEIKYLRRYTNEFFEYIDLNNLNETVNILKNKKDFELINEFKLFFYKAKMYFIQKDDFIRAGFCAKINLELKQFLVKERFLDWTEISKFS